MIPLKVRSSSSVRMSPTSHSHSGNRSAHMVIMALAASTPVTRQSVFDEVSGDRHAASTAEVEHRRVPRKQSQKPVEPCLFDKSVATITRPSDGVALVKGDDAAGGVTAAARGRQPRLSRPRLFRRQRHTLPFVQRPLTYQKCTQLPAETRVPEVTLLRNTLPCNSIHPALPFRNATIPLVTAAAYLARPSALSICAASSAFFMLPSSTRTAGY